MHSQHNPSREAARESRREEREYREAEYKEWERSKRRPAKQDELTDACELFRQNNPDYQDQ